MPVAPNLNFAVTPEQMPVVDLITTTDSDTIIRNGQIQRWKWQLPSLV